jgi:peptidoglycan/LPS O-acetylase OafA/YrhL
MKLFSLNAGTSRVFGLDLLRFFAIIFVVVGHSMILVPKDIKKHVV